jgi:excisionase family DNA binding protein
MKELGSVYLSKKGLCEYFGVSIGKVENLMYGGKMKYVKFGRNVRFDIRDVEDFMRCNKVICD